MNFAPGFSAMGNDESYGMTVLPGENKLVASLLAEPTPGTDNAAAVVSSKPTFSRPGGLFNSSFPLEISISDPECHIRYTLDGSVLHMHRRSIGPLTIDRTSCIRAAAFRAKYIPGKTSTRSYIFLPDAIHQPVLPEGFPLLWKNVAADYEMAQDIITNTIYGPMMQPSLLALPTISIVTSLENLFDSSTEYIPTLFRKEWHGNDLLPWRSFCPEVRKNFKLTADCESREVLFGVLI
jgi:hypothetical protein